jgi:hypothetical protein
MRAQEVEVISTRKTQASYKTRADTFARVRFIESGAVREVNVRNLYDFWDSYMDEREHKEAEQRRAQIEAQAKLDAIKREKQEKRDKGQKIARNLAYKLSLDTSVVQYNEYAETITIRTRDLEYLIA